MNTRLSLLSIAFLSALTQTGLTAHSPFERLPFIHRFNMYVEQQYLMQPSLQLLQPLQVAVTGTVKSSLEPKLLAATRTASLLILLALSSSCLLVGYLIQESADEQSGNHFSLAKRVAPARPAPVCLAQTLTEQAPPALAMVPLLINAVTTVTPPVPIVWESVTTQQTAIAREIVKLATDVRSLHHQIARVQSLTEPAAVAAQTEPQLEESIQAFMAQAAVSPIGAAALAANTQLAINQAASNLQMRNHRPALNLPANISAEELVAHLAAPPHAQVATEQLAQLPAEQRLDNWVTIRGQAPNNQAEIAVAPRADSSLWREIVQEGCTQDYRSARAAFSSAPDNYRTTSQAIPANGNGLLLHTAISCFVYVGLRLMKALEHKPADHVGRDWFVT